MTSPWKSECSVALQARSHWLCHGTPFGKTGIVHCLDMWFIQPFEFILVIVLAHSRLRQWFGSEQGWGLLSRFPPFRYFPNFSALSKHTLYIEYHVYIWQVSPQLSCGDTCQIWKWFKESNRYFWKIENFANGEINERSFSNPHPWATSPFLKK